MWLAKDKDGEIFLYKDKPFFDIEKGNYEISGNNLLLDDFICLDKNDSLEGKLLRNTV